MRGWIKRLLGINTAKRSYAAAKGGRLYSDWTRSVLSADTEIRRSLSVVRARSRSLAMNNDYARRFYKKLICNVIGDTGIKLQISSPNPDLSCEIEGAFEDWGKKGNPTICGRFSWIEAQKLFLESVARDGECLVRIARSGDMPIALEFLEPDLLDEHLNKTLDGGSYIEMGIERNASGRAIYYHLLKEHPGSDIMRRRDQKYMRIKASEIIHGAVLERPSQSRGMPWMHSAMRRLKMLSSYEEAELVAARVAASKMGFFTSPDGASYSGEVDSGGQISMEAQPGSFEQLPSGVDLKIFDPHHPSNSFAEFEKCVLRGIASGLDISYNSLANDLEGVNFSSIRHGALEDRDSWRSHQRWMMENLLTPIFEAWLLMAATSGHIKIKPSQLHTIKHSWKARGWPWIDPLKENQANREAIAAMTKTRSQIISEQGGDIEEIFKQSAREKELAAKYDVELEDNINAQAKN